MTKPKDAPGVEAGEPAPSPREHVTTGTESLARLAAEHGTTPSAVLEATAADGLDPRVAAVLDEVFRATRSVVTPLPEGLRLTLPAEDAP